MATTKKTTAKDAPAAMVDTAPGTKGTDVVCHMEHGYITDKTRSLTRLKRIEGQARGIHRMVEEEKYCIDILTQVSALTKALESVALGPLHDHLKHCVMDAAAEGGPVAEAKLKLRRHRPPGPLLVHRHRQHATPTISLNNCSSSRRERS